VLDTDNEVRRRCKTHASRRPRTTQWRAGCARGAAMSSRSFLREHPPDLHVPVALRDAFG